MKRRSARARGLTLIEIVVVITITSMLMTAVAVSALRIHQDSLRKTARLDVRTLLDALDLYRLAKGRYPEPAKGLGALYEQQLVKELPVDPWGHAYVYALEDGRPVITSYGDDGQPGGAGDDADVSSRAPGDDDE